MGSSARPLVSPSPQYLALSPWSDTEGCLCRTEGPQSLVAPESVFRRRASGAPTGLVKQLFVSALSPPITSLSLPYPPLPPSPFLYLPPLPLPPAPSLSLPPCPSLSLPVPHSHSLPVPPVLPSPPSPLSPHLSSGAPTAVPTSASTTGAPALSGSRCPARTRLCLTAALPQARPDMVCLQQRSRMGSCAALLHAE